MAKLEKMPQRQIIDGYKGTIDFYYWKGIPVARKWPIYIKRTPTPIELTYQQAFSYINKLWASLPLIIHVQLTLFAARSTLTPKDFLVRGYLKGLFEIMPPEYYATEETQLLLLAQLDVALSTRALEAGGNLAAILAQLDVALSTRALEAGGNLAAVLARLDAIKVTRGDLVKTEQTGVVTSTAAYTQVVNITAKGVLVGLNFTTDYNLTQLRLTIDGNLFDLLARDGSAFVRLGPEGINTLGGETTYFKEDLYDGTNNYYAFHLKREVQYNSNLTAHVRQQSGVNKNIGCHVYYRPIT